MIVLDASAALAMMSGTEEGQGLRGLVLQGERIIAPELYRYEILNAITKYVRGGYISKEQGLSWYEAGTGLVDGVVSAGELGEMGAEILSESLALEHPSYDISYLVLARRTGSTLFTLDKRLVEACEHRDVSCVDMMKL